MLLRKPGLLTGKGKTEEVGEEVKEGVIKLNSVGSAGVSIFWGVPAEISYRKRMTREEFIAIIGELAFVYYNRGGKV